MWAVFVEFGARSGLALLFSGEGVTTIRARLLEIEPSETVNVIERSALVSYSAEQMYQLVNDIAAYPQFMDGCDGAEILAAGDGWLEARLDLSMAGMRQSFTTRNTLVAPESVHMALVSGPFQALEGDWRFTPLTASACKVSFELRFEFANKMLALAAGKWFEKIASRQVDALTQRAQVVYGPAA